MTEKTYMKLANKIVYSIIHKLIGDTIGVLIVSLISNGIGMWIYNSILPELYGFKHIGYWQMYGLYMICHYLFKPHKIKIDKTES